MISSHDFSKWCLRSEKHQINPHLLKIDKLGLNMLFFLLDDPKLASRVHAFLSRYGLINFGVYKILKMPPTCK